MSNPTNTPDPPSFGGASLQSADLVARLGE